MSIHLISSVCLVATATLLLAGCGGATSGSSSGDSTSGDTVTSPVLPSVPASGSSRPPEGNAVVPQPSAEHQMPSPWTRAVAVPGEPAVLIHGTLTGAPPCQVVGTVQAREDETSVVVTVHVGSEPGADCSGPQIEVGFPYVVRVPLAVPVGDRAVRDGSLD